MQAKTQYATDRLPKSIFAARVLASKDLSDLDYFDAMQLEFLDDLIADAQPLRASIGEILTAKARNNAR